MGKFSKKARNLLALLLAAGTWQASFPVALLLTSSFVTADVAYAAVESGVAIAPRIRSASPGSNVTPSSAAGCSIMMIAYLPGQMLFQLMVTMKELRLE
ncbi:hypothetical protein WA1_26765 [Scytonema hofmannii PCC 7110]|uniref:Uncharacterized protein n=1 Tax=Scytonema hofmannii PCC 7110 TaxID=128403 RepID=A0A139X6U3_9CYAN|nr:hypothetical protein [Scytonema hofmannii]KYC40417.1 hypothetical protein WA1_26765 [Scytonema hofmannii PCC 7110]